MINIYPPFIQSDRGAAAFGWTNLSDAIPPFHITQKHIKSVKALQYITRITPFLLPVHSGFLPWSMCKLLNTKHTHYDYDSDRMVTIDASTHVPYSQLISFVPHLSENLYMHSCHVRCQQEQFFPSQPAILYKLEMLITSSKIRSDERTTLYLDSAPPYIIWLSAVAISHFDGK